jgi:hypothetical protein
MNGASKLWRNMERGIEIYVRPSGNRVMLMFHIPEEIREHVLKGLAKGHFDPQGTEIYMELDALPQFRSESSQDHLRFRITNITL